MSKLRGQAKEDFLRRMARGRKKARTRKPAAKHRRRTNPPTGERAALQKELRSWKRKRPTGGSLAEIARIEAELKKLKPAAKKRANTKRKPARAAARGTKSKPRRRRRNSDIEEARSGFEQFHQKPSTRVIEVSQAYKYPDNYYELGKLKELRFDLDPNNKAFPLTHFGPCMVVSTADGSNIYLIGGNQKVDLSALDIASDKDFIELGPCTYISYHTQKGFHDFEPIDYFHHFGEDDGIFPNLTYDRLNETLFLVSGNYRVRPEGIVN